MTIAEEILRVAAKGDGVTASGRFFAGAAPGDVVQPDGSLQHGPHHNTPPCRHFGTCGGCQLQHLDDETLRRFVAERVANAAVGQGLEPERIDPPHLSPPHTRRRASLRAESSAGRVVIGFREGGSHKIVDLGECPVMAPELFAVIAPLRKLLNRQSQGKGAAAKAKPKGGRPQSKSQSRIAVDIEMALAEQGVDLGLKGLVIEGLTATEAMLDFARDNGLARLVLDQGYGPESLWEPEPVTVSLSGTSVPLPPGSFLQATVDGEQALADAAREWLAGAATIADLFAGLGTFAFALAGETIGEGASVLAVEAARDAHLACKSAASRGQRPIQSLHRDLFRNPLMPDELNRFAAVVLDPPRAGAREQVARLAEASVPRVVYVSCNPSSWARDAATLIASGYRLEQLRPVGQFRWSTHVELVSLFVR